MALSSYSVGANCKDITFIEHYHEAPTLEPVLKRYIAFSEERNHRIRTLLSQLEQADAPQQKQHLLAALSSLQNSHEQDLSLLKNLLSEPETSL